MQRTTRSIVEQQDGSVPGPCAHAALARDRPAASYEVASQATATAIAASERSHTRGAELMRASLEVEIAMVVFTGC